MVTQQRENGGLGIKKMRNMNLAFLAKMGWRLITESYKLWAKNLHAEYVRGKMDFSELEKKRNASNAWKWMVATREIIKQGTS